MSRPLRIVYPGALYHLTSRGNERRPIFYEDSDRHHFFRILANTIERFSWTCYAYCLMDNHFHLLVETLHANISESMKFLNGVYTQYFNWKHKRVGHLFQGRFKSILVEKESYFLELCRYIPLNPVRAGICRNPADYLWSSYRATAGLVAAPSFLNVGSVWERFGCNEDLAKLSYQSYVNDGSDRCPWENLKGQIYLGSDAFLQSLLKPPNVHASGISKTQTYPVRPSLETLLALPDGHCQAQEHGYRIHEIADFFGVHRNTVSRWMKGMAGVKSQNAP